MIMDDNFPDCRPQGDGRTLEANPDISGIGVLVGFLATAWTTFMVLIFYYVVTPEESDNTLDRSTHKAIQKLFNKVSSSQWASAVEAVVLALSDQLLVTGLAFIISGYYQTGWGLSVYHWQTVLRLVWFSSVTHIATLTCLEKYFQKRRYIWYARAFLMTGLVIMLAVGIAFNGSDRFSYLNDTSLLGAPAVCSFHHEHYFNIIQGWDTLGSEILLVGGLVVRTIQMFSTTRMFCCSLLQALRKLWRGALVWCCGKFQLSCRFFQVISLTLVVFALAASVTIQSILDFLHSRIVGLLWLLISLTWGSTQLFGLRNLGKEFNKLHIPRNENDYIYEEDTWSFGQLVPVLMLLIPLLLIAEGCSEVTHWNTECKDNNARLELQIGTHEHLGVIPISSDSTSHISQDQANQRTTVLPQSTVLNVPSIPMQNTLNPLSVRISNLCKRHYHNEAWYLDNMLLAMATAIGMACCALLPSSEKGYVIINAPMLLKLMIIFLFYFFSLLLVPLCGILDSLEPEQRIQRHPLSIVRLVIHPGKVYRVSRFICFALCPTLATILISIPDVATKIYSIPLVVYPPLASLPIMSIIVASFMTLGSVWKQTSGNVLP